MILKKGSLKKLPALLKVTFFNTLHTLPITVACMAVATLTANAIFHLSGNAINVSIIYILAILLHARYTKCYSAGIIASLYSMFWVNYAYTYPYMTLNFTLSGYPLTFVGMTFISCFTSSICIMLSKQSVQIQEKDRMVHHPYESFNAVVDFVAAAASDPDVLAIKQTLYRVSGNSPIIAALIKAAENGKQVTVLVELKARFDEENNINWAKKLEHAGCHVIYGLTGLKTHCKILLVVRKEEGGIRRYLHMGTGNYNDSTARFYTDIGMFTCKDLFGVDASSLFNVLTGYSIPPQYHKMIVAPGGMRSFFERMIRSETENARKGLPSGITVKVNSLVDPEIIRLLYEASQAGVEIKLIVRGICCLIPGLPGVSENITVYSIVGQLLEHSRIFKFENAGNPKIYMGSADWMPRNLDRRVELVFPIDDQDLKERAFGILELMLSDTVNARIQQPDTTYAHIDKRGKAVINSQTEFARLAREALEAKQVVDEKKPYVPKKAPTFDQRELED